MMKRMYLRTVPFVAVFCTATAFATAISDGAQLFTPAELLQKAGEIGAQPRNHGLAVTTIATLPGPKMPNETFAPNSLLLVDRIATGQSELHQTEHDVYSIVAGTGTLIVGGEIVGGRKTGATEIRGDSVKGGTRRRVSAGDVVMVPAGVAHQMTLDPGAHMTYTVFKALAAR